MGIWPHYFLILTGLNTDGKDLAERHEGLMDTSKVSGKAGQYSSQLAVTLMRLKRR